MTRPILGAACPRRRPLALLVTLGSALTLAACAPPAGDRRDGAEASSRASSEAKRSCNRKETNCGGTCVDLGRNPRACGPFVDAFVARRSVVTAGAAVTLSWTTRQATAVSLEPAVGVVSGSSVTVAPEATTTYTLTATNEVNVTRSSVTVVVCPADLACATVAAGRNPTDVAFDGASIWVANGGSSDLTRFAAATLTVQGTYPSGGSWPEHVLFDGANLWVSNTGSATVAKLRATDGELLATFAAAGKEPHGLAFDGAAVWVADGDGTVTKLRASDGAVLKTIVVGSAGFGVAFDGTHVWATNVLELYVDGRPQPRDRVAKIRASDGHVVQQVDLGQYHGTGAVVFDGANLWLPGNEVVRKVRAADGAVLGEFPVRTVPYYAAFDGAHVWVAGPTDGVVKLRADTGEVVDVITVGDYSSYLGGQLAGIAFDGEAVWVAEFQGDVVTKL